MNIHREGRLWKHKTRNRN